MTLLMEHAGATTHENTPRWREGLRGLRARRAVFSLASCFVVFSVFVALRGTVRLGKTKGVHFVYQKKCAQPLLLLSRSNPH